MFEFGIGFISNFNISIPNQSFNTTRFSTWSWGRKRTSRSVWVPCILEGLPQNKQRQWKFVVPAYHVRSTILRDKPLRSSHRIGEQRVWSQILPKSLLAWLKMYAIQFHIPTGVISHQKTQRPPMSPSNILVFPDILKFSWLKWTPKNDLVT